MSTRVLKSWFHVIFDEKSLLSSYETLKQMSSKFNLKSLYCCLYTAVAPRLPATVAFFLNPPKGAGHCQNIAESKIRQHFYFKKFWKVATFMLGQKNFQVKINSSIDFVFSDYQIYIDI